MKIVVLWVILWVWEIRNMSLINCPECNREVSDKAGSCPNCGCPIGKSTPEIKTNNVNQNLPKVEAKSGVIDGVKLGCGMFVVLPLIIIGIGFLLFIILIIIGANSSPTHY